MAKKELTQDSINEWRRQAVEKFPSFEAIINSVDMGFDRSGTKTAEAETGRININKSFMAGLGDSEQLFIIMHEVCHIAFDHITEIADKDPELWNIACDAVINGWLKKRGLALPPNAIFMPDAVAMLSDDTPKFESVDALYWALVRRKENGDEPVPKADPKAPEATWQRFGAVGGICDDHSGWQGEAEKVKRGEIEKPRKLHYPESKAFIVNEQTLEHRKAGAKAASEREEVL
jgi:hypothetical protein